MAKKVIRAKPRAKPRVQVNKSEQIKNAVIKAREIVNDIYKEDERIPKKQDDELGLGMGQEQNTDFGMGEKDKGIAKETDVVFQEVLRHLLSKLK